ncbi:MAG: SoxR reducing system RseC family protein [Bacteroidia bacterium]|nr:SoxR reducing system RseC family protein [Bacteroidia bacterium]NNF32082.1 SoxR reducing system RseC family protein [Flavobacteriaceae bacterium]MBT8275121.1 SoxR reducing system RseC family protein [Bacteroidia bacterium]NNJ82268.1 SoxR reducing system RseC family protein [Flavobacteriaceae bacterium]NNK54946.1 SoxR reducing system RseC family protein [Flavobacteriaceae bacterium]
MESLASNNNTFVHSGTVSRISGNSVFVSLDPNIHCDSCRAKSACGISDSKSKEIEITDPSASFTINEHVEVVINRALGLKAVFWAYLFPFILLTCVLVIASSFLPEWQAGLLALGILVPYYALLHYTKSFFKRKFKISVLKLV